jgi:hypothetical protein
MYLPLLWGFMLTNIISGYMIPYDHSKQITPLGVTNWRNENKRFGIKLEDRYSHMLVLGSTGVGKSFLMLQMAESDMRSGFGLCFLEPHGDACVSLLDRVPENRKRDVVYFDPANTAHRTGYNPLHGVPKEHRHLVASEMIEAFKKIWFPDGGAPRTEHILRYCILTLLEYPAATLCDITALLLDSAFRNLVLHYTDDLALHSFWYGEFENYAPRLRSEAISPILNKAGIFNANAVLREVLGQQYGIDISEIMNDGKILICNLSKGLVGNDVSQILGSLITTGIQTAAMQRATLPPESRKPFLTYVDECQTFLTTSFVELLSQVRKYRVGLCLATQSMFSLPEDVRNCLIANCGTMLSFRCGSMDARLMAIEFFPVFRQEDFASLPKYHFYIKLLINGTASRPFSAETVIALNEA